MTSLSESLAVVSSRPFGDPVHLLRMRTALPGGCQAVQDRTPEPGPFGGLGGSGVSTVRSQPVATSGCEPGCTGAGSSPCAPRYRWIAAAAARPSAIAQTISEAP